MAKEIERKFLVLTEFLPKKLPVGEEIIQAYLSTKPMIRIRAIGKRQTFLTIKGEGTLVRDEFEYPIPPKDFAKLLLMCDKIIWKIRRRINNWYVDEFKVPDGIWMAECELKSTETRLPSMPPWLGPEVTDKVELHNVNLACQLDWEPLPSDPAEVARGVATTTQK